MTTTVTMWLGDVRQVLDRLIQEGRTYDLLVTSPPFWQLRAYLPDDHESKADEIGGEATPGEFLDTMYALTARYSQLIPEWGSICVELGDSMASSGGAGGDYGEGGLREGQEWFDGSARASRSVSPKFREGTPRWDGRPAGQVRTTTSDPTTIGNRGGRGGRASMVENAIGGHHKGGAGMPLGKSMCLIPHCYTIGLAYGFNPLTGQPSPAGQWRVRNVVVWSRPNPPVGSLGKRDVHKRTGDSKFRPACSYITIACRGRDRYFDLDAVRIEPSANTHTRVPINGGAPRFDLPSQQREGNWSTLAANNDTNPAGSPPLDWHVDDLDGDWLWRLNTQPYSGAHYACFPLALPRRLLLAMCPQRVCAQCGWPAERILAAADGYDDHLGKSWADKAEGRGKANSGARSAHAGQPIGKPHIVNAEYVTVGWTDCGCVCQRCNGAGQVEFLTGIDQCPDCASTGRAPYRPGHALDPFGGSGTTAVAAALEGRDATLIDFDRRNIALVHGRLKESLHVLEYVADDEKVVWTVEAPLPNQKAQTDGQMSFLGDLS